MKKLIIIIVVFIQATPLFAQNQKFVINSSPSEAIVYINGVEIGETPLSYTLNMSFKNFFRYEFKISAEGYEDYSVVYETKPSDYSEKINAVLIPRVKKLDSTNKGAIAFEKMIFSIPEGKEIGKRTNFNKTTSSILWESTAVLGTIEFNRDIEDLLEQAGYNVAQQTKLFADATRKNVPTMLLGADLKDITLNYTPVTTTYGSNSTSVKTGLCEMTIEWQVFSLTRQKILFKSTTRGSYMVESNPMNIAISGAMKNSLARLMESDSFRTVVMSEGSGSNYDKKIQNIEIKKILAVDYVDRAAMIQNAVQSVVTVNNGMSHGSGFIVGENGVIITNHHVIKGATDDLTVTFNNGFILPAKVHSYDEQYDLAVLTLTGGGYKPLPLGDSDKAGLGEDVYVIGTPVFKELSQTISKGLLSGKRTIDENQYIQIDANINGGNSGGPVLNQKGEVIGIATMKYANAEGLGLAIPINVAVEKLGIIIK